MVRVLDGLYGGTKWAAHRTRPDPVDAVVRTILSQNTNDANRDLAYRALRSKFRNWDEVRQAHLASLKSAIRTAGLAGQKAPAIRGFLNWLQSERGSLQMGFLRNMPVDEAVETLTQHKGIGLKTAYVVLGFAFDRDLCAVDTHVHRILKRTGVIDARCGREKAHSVLRPLIPEGRALSFHMNLLDHGKTTCTARTPSCGSCAISHLCRYRRRARDEA
jgi:endonuclease-3